MEKLRKFNTEEEFLNVKNSLDYPQVSLTQDNGKVWVKEDGNYILAVYDFSLSYGDGNNLYYSNNKPNWIINEELVEENEDNKVTYKFHVDETFESISLDRVFSRDYGGTSYGIDSVKMTYIDFSHLKTKINDLYRMSNHLTSVTFGDNFDTTLITSMRYLFLDCGSLTSIDLSSFDTSNVIDMTGMFARCRSLTSVTFGDEFDTSNVESMSEMFYGCNALTSTDNLIGINNFNTPNLYSTGKMFESCVNLALIDLNSFDLSNSTYISDMFWKCNSLTSITFGNKADVSNVLSYTSNYYRMFTDISSECVLNLCENTRSSWETLLNNLNEKPSNIVYRNCTE